VSLSPSAAALWIAFGATKGTKSRPDGAGSGIGNGNGIGIGNGHGDEDANEVGGRR